MNEKHNKNCHKQPATRAGTPVHQRLVSLGSGFDGSGGQGAADAVLELWMENPGPVSIFCGRDNNGGDGLVVRPLPSFVGSSCSSFSLYKMMPESEPRSARRTIDGAVKQKEKGKGTATVSGAAATMSSEESNIIFVLLGMLGVEVDDSAMPGRILDQCTVVRRRAASFTGPDRSRGRNSQAGD